MLLENLLANVLVKNKDVEGGKKWRPFSHVTKHPDDVESWVPVTLDELGDTVYFDKRSVTVMNERDVTFYIAKKRSVPFLHAVRVSEPKVEEVHEAADEAADEAAESPDAEQ